MNVLLTPDPADSKAVMQHALKLGETGVWSKLGPVVLGGSPENFSVRDLFTYALVLCEAGGDLSRLHTLFREARDLQNKTGDRRGNFPWDRKREEKDSNAADFCMRGAALLLLRHRNQMPQASRDLLMEMVTPALKYCMGYEVTPKYTNIALMNAMNLILLGEMLGEQHVVAEGKRRLESFCIYTWEWGIHEYCSPTYTGVQMYCLGLLLAHAQDLDVKHQAEALLNLLWTDVALNRLSPSDRLGGAFSRKLRSYFRRTGEKDASLENVMWSVRWLPVPSADAHMRLVYAALAQWPTLSHLDVLSRTYPREIRQSWGPTQSPSKTRRSQTSRTHYVCEEVSLSSASAGYDLPAGQDVPLAVDFHGSLRCYFVSDVDNNPYNTEDPPGKGRYSPLLWVAAQEKEDVLGVVFHGNSSWADTLKSHLILPRDVDEVWIGNTRVDVNAHTVVETLHAEEPLVLRKGTGVVGMQVLWSRRMSGEEGAVQFSNDDAKKEMMRLTVIHHRIGGKDRPKTRSGAAFWVRIGSGVADADFAAWRNAFSTAGARIQSSWNVGGDLKGLKAEVDGQNGPLVVEIVSPGSDRYICSTTPPLHHSVLEVNGKELGRPLLEGLGPIKTYEKKLNRVPVLQVPGVGEAEDARVVPPMEVVADVSARGGEYVEMPNRAPKNGNDAASVTWRLEIPVQGSYYIWGRIRAPGSGDDSFHVRTFVDDAKGRRQYLQIGAWHTGVYDDWEWVRVDLREMGRLPDPMVFDFPVGEVRFQLFAREDGTQIDCLYITADKSFVPAGKM